MNPLERELTRRRRAGQCGLALATILAIAAGGVVSPGARQPRADALDIEQVSALVTLVEERNATVELSSLGIDARSAQLRGTIDASDLLALTAMVANVDPPLRIRSLELGRDATTNRIAFGLDVAPLRR